MLCYIQRVKRWSRWLRHCCTRRKLRLWFLIVSLNFSFVYFWIRMNIFEKWIQRIFPVLKIASAYGWQHYCLNCSSVLKSGSLILLEPSGPVYACRGIVLPFCFTQWDDLNLYVTYSSLFVNWINIRRPTLHPHLHLWHQNIGTWYCSPRDHHGWTHWNHRRLSVRT